MVSSEKNLKIHEITAPGYENIVGKVLVSPADGWEGYVMRVFEVGEEGYSGKHSHEYPHIVYIIDGKGTLFLDGKDYPLEKESFMFIPPEKEHQLLNNGKDTFKFMCVVPERGHVGFED